MKHTYSISDAAKILQTESHVLRYWEEELELAIPRNEHGHRYYRETDLNTFTKIKDLKEKGYSLQDIRFKLSGINPSNENTALSPGGFKSTLSLSAAPKDTKLSQFKEIMNSIIGQAVSKNNEELTKTITEKTSERVIKEMNYLFRTFDEDEETRHKQLEAAIQAAIGAKHEIASAKEKRKLFKHKNKSK